MYKASYFLTWCSRLFDIGPNLGSVDDQVGLIILLQLDHHFDKTLSLQKNPTSALESDT